MKKIYYLLIVLTVFLTSCTTTKSLKYQDFEEKNFTVNHIMVTSTTISPTDEEVLQIFENLPMNDIDWMVFDNSGGFELLYEEILNEDIKYNIETAYLYDVETGEDIEELREWHLNLDTDDVQLCDISFTMDPPNGYLTADVVLYTKKIIPSEKEGKEDKVINYRKKFSWYFDDWTYKNIFIDPRSCAQIRFNKNIKPTFIDNELYSVYENINSAENGYVNVNPKDDVTILCNIYDKGSFIASPTTIYNVEYKGKLQTGKQYYLTYKLKRFSLNSNKWKVVFNLKEIKPGKGKKD